MFVERSVREMKRWMNEDNGFIDDYDDDDVHRKKTKHVFVKLFLWLGWGILGHLVWGTFIVWAALGR